MRFSKILSILFAVVFLLGTSLIDLASAKGRGSGSRSSHSSYRSSSSHRGYGSSHRSSYGTHRSSYSSKSSSGSRRSSYSAATRDSRGHIKRSGKAKNDFKRHNPCPSTGKASGSCPGYVIDHVTPLKRGGADRPNNMQWQTKEAAKAKDKWE